MNFALGVHTDSWRDFNPVFSSGEKKKIFLAFSFPFKRKQEVGDIKLKSLKARAMIGVSGDHAVEEEFYCKDVCSWCSTVTGKVDFLSL
jgi:hypothetical protein